MSSCPKFSDQITSFSYANCRLQLFNASSDPVMVFDVASLTWAKNPNTGQVSLRDNNGSVAVFSDSQWTTLGLTFANLLTYSGSCNGVSS